MRLIKIGHTSIEVHPKIRRYVNVRPGDSPYMSEADSFAYSLLGYAGGFLAIVVIAALVLCVILGGWAIVVCLAGMVALGALYIRYGLDPVDGQLEARKQRKLAKRNP